MQKLLVTLGVCAAVAGGLTVSVPARAADGPMSLSSMIAVDPSDPSGNTVYAIDPSPQSPDLPRAELSGQISVQPTADPRYLAVHLVVRNTGTADSGPFHTSLKIVCPSLPPISEVIPMSSLSAGGGADTYSFMLWIPTSIHSIQAHIDVFDVAKEGNEADNVLGIDVWEHAYY